MSPIEGATLNERTSGDDVVAFSGVGGVCEMSVNEMSPGDSAGRGRLVVNIGYDPLVDSARGVC